MLKRSVTDGKAMRGGQPPSGGCVLKLLACLARSYYRVAAAFRRLCVETRKWRDKLQKWVAAAFRRLCVETRWSINRD